MQELVNRTLEWADEKGILEKGTVEGQSLKTIEELSEVLKEVVNHDIEKLKVELGDVIVTIIIGYYLQFKGNIRIYTTRSTKNLPDKAHEINATTEFIDSFAGQILDRDYYRHEGIGFIRLVKSFGKRYNFTIEECLEKALEKIEGRQGEMVDGQFVKESDL